MDSIDELLEHVNNEFESANSAIEIVDGPIVIELGEADAGGLQKIDVAGPLAARNRRLRGIGSAMATSGSEAGRFTMLYESALADCVTLPVIVERLETLRRARYSLMAVLVLRRTDTQVIDTQLSNFYVAMEELRRFAKAVPAAATSAMPKGATEIALLQWLQQAQIDDQAGIALVDIPESLRSETILTACDAKRLIEFGQRKHFFTGVGKLNLETGYVFDTLNKPNRKSVRQAVREAIEDTKPKEIAIRVRLTNQGHADAACASVSVTAVSAKSDTSIEPSCGLHSSGEKRPDRFQYGPVIASRVEVGYAIRQAGTRAATTDQAHREYLRTNGARLFADRIYAVKAGEREPLQLWFADRDRLNEIEGAIILYRSRKGTKVGTSQRKQIGQK